MKAYYIIHKNTGDKEKLIGKLLQKDKRIPERSSGYTIYLDVNGILKKFSAFNYNIEEIKEEIKKEEKK